jgi:molybdopterin converting factor small subunit
VTIRVTCLGHIKTSVGREKVELQGDGMTAGELIDAIRKMGAADQNLGFTKFNTLLVVNGKSAFTAAADDRRLEDGDEVLLLPFSHGG